MQPHLFTLVLFFRLLVHGAELLKGPQSQNVVLGATVTFTCIGNSSAHIKFMAWRFNGSTLNSDNFANMDFSLVSANLNSLTLESNLSFTALSQYNNSNIQCTFFEVLGNVNYGSDNVESELAYLRIQGLLGSVIDLNVLYSLPETLVSWTAPFTLEGLNINYDVTITDESSGITKPVVTLTDTTQYMFSTTELIACHSYSFTVQTRNSAGGGNISSIEEFFPGGPVLPSLQAVTVVELTVDKDEGNVNAVLTFPITTECFDQQNITATVQSHNDTYTTTTNINNQMEVSVSILGLPANIFLSVELTLSNSFGKAKLTGISINTHSVQGLEIVQTNSSGSTCFRCIFVNNTLSTGCLIILKLESSTSMCTSVLYDYRLSLSLSPSDDTNSNSVTGCIDGIYAGMYTVEAYDTDLVNISKEAAVSHVGVFLKGLTCAQGDTSSTDLFISITSTTSLIIPKPTINHVDNNGTNLRTAGILIGVFSGLVIVVLAIMISVFFYNRCHSKGGVLRITVDTSQSTPIRTERVSELSSTSDSPPQLLGIQSYASTNKFLNYPPTLQDITLETTVQTEPQVPENVNKDYNKETTIQSRTGSVHSHSTNSSSSDLAPRTKYGSGDYDHLLYDEDKENSLDDVVVDTKTHQEDQLEFYIQESEVL